MLAMQGSRFFALGFAPNPSPNYHDCHNEQEALKARQKEKTAELEKKMVELKKFYGDSKKAVKMKLPKESWKEFGIEDLR